MPGSKSRDFDQVSVVFGAILVDTGSLNPDGGLTIEYDSPRFTDVVGAGGEVARGRTNDYRATVTLSVLQSSDVNDLLSAQMDLDATGSGVGMVPLLIRDRNGSTLYIGEKAWINSTPAMTMGNTPGFNDWEIRVASLKPFIGGND